MKKFYKFLYFCFTILLILNFTSCKKTAEDKRGEFIIFTDKLTGERENISNEERAKRLREDLDYYREAILEFPSNFNNFSKEDFVEKVDELKTKVDTLTDLEFLIELKKITAMFKEVHIHITKDSKRVYVDMEKILIGDDIHINSPYLDEDFKYGKLLKINETDVETLKKKFRKVTSADNYSSFLAYMKLNDLDILRGLGIVSNIDDVNVTVEKNGKEKTFLIKPVIQEKWYPICRNHPMIYDRNTYKKILEKQKKNDFENVYVPKLANSYDYVINSDKKSIILNYNACYESMDKDSVTFFKELSEKIIRQKQDGNLDRIIVNVRRNGGGYRVVLRPFLNFLSEFFKENKDVNLIILSDRPTVSAGLVAILDLRNSNKNSVVVGMSPGGGLKFAGGQLAEYMPNSKIGFGFSTMYTSQPRHAGYEGDGTEPETTEEEYSRNMLIPDIRAFKTIEDYENKTDSVMERALNGEFDKIK